MGKSGSTDLVVAPAVSQRMRAVRRRDTGVEWLVRSAVHRRGLRYRLNVQISHTQRVTPDLVFVRARVAVFVDGCFWHMCPIHGTIPKRNRDWWVSKLNANVARDRMQDQVLAAEGWVVVRAWEHDDPELVADRISRALRNGPDV